MLVSLKQLHTFALEQERVLGELASYAGISRDKMERLARVHSIPYRKRALFGSLTEEEKEIFVEMFKAGETVKAMMGRTGRAHKTIRDFLRSQHLTRTLPTGPGASLGAERQSLMMQMFEAGAENVEIAEAIGLSPETISRYRYQLGIALEKEPEENPAPVVKRGKDMLSYWTKWQAKVFGNAA